MFGSLFCFFSAFKRIAMIAIVIALFFGYLLKFIARYNQKTAINLITFLSIILIAILVLYVALIKAGAFELLEKAGIETSGRVEVYKAVDHFYEFDPGFLGKGIGFLTYQLNTNMSIDVASIHNDFLQHYIDLGFFGYIIWLVAMTLTRIRYFGRKGNVDSAIVSFILIVYLIVVSSTDNTMNYPLLTGVLALLMMGNSYDQDVRETENKIFGSISEPNKDKKDGMLI